MEQLTELVAVTSLKTSGNEHHNTHRTEKETHKDLREIHDINSDFHREMREWQVNLNNFGVVGKSMANEIKVTVKNYSKNAKSVLKATEAYHKEIQNRCLETVPLNMVSKFNLVKSREAIEKLNEKNTLLSQEYEQLSQQVTNMLDGIQTLRKIKVEMDGLEKTDSDIDIKNLEVYRSQLRKLHLYSNSDMKLTIFGAKCYEWVRQHKKLSAGMVFTIIALGGLIYYFLSKNENDDPKKEDDPDNRNQGMRISDEVYREMTDRLQQTMKDKFPISFKRLNIILLEYTVLDRNYEGPEFTKDNLKDLAGQLKEIDRMKYDEVVNCLIAFRIEAQRLSFNTIKKIFNQICS